jgi:hypothetical protein
VLRRKSWSQAFQVIDGYAASLKKQNDDRSLKAPYRGLGQQCRGRFLPLTRLDSTQGNATMNGFMLVRHKVKNFPTWKEGYDAHAPKRAAAGLTEKYLLHSTNAPNEIVLLFEAQDINRAQAFAESADLRETMQGLGVIDKPDIYFLNR